MAKSTAKRTARKPAVGLIMGSQSDWATMRHAAETLEALGVPFEARIISAHRTPKRMMSYAAAAKGRGLKVIIAGAGLAAALPGVVAAHTDLPVIGVPLTSKTSVAGGLWGSGVTSAKPPCTARCTGPGAGTTASTMGRGSRSSASWSSPVPR